jgi:DNA polymerase-4
VDLDAFFVAVERRRDPSLVGRPVIVGGLPGERGVVACASYEARAHGVRAGMPLHQAALLCPRASTVFLHGEHAAYAQASREVMEILGRFTPQVEPLSLDEALLDMTGCERAHPRGWLDAAARLHRTVAEETGLSVSIGIGGTRAVASIAASLAKPSGAMEVRRGEEAAFLASLPLEHLPGVGPAMRKDLARFNLHTIGDLARIPPEVLEESFGKVGVELSRRARGLEASEDDVPVGERRAMVRTISRVTSFPKDTDDPHLVDAMLSYLAQRASRAMREEGLKARAVGVRLRYSDFRTVEARRTLPRPTAMDREILDCVRTLWPQRWDRRVRLRLVGVVLHDLVPDGERQLDLFAALPRPSAALPHPSAALPRTAPGNGHADGGDLLDHPAGAGSVRERSLQYVASGDERLDRAVDRVRERHGFGSLVRGRAIDLLHRLPRAPEGFRLRTPSCSA